MTKKRFCSCGRIIKNSKDDLCLACKTKLLYERTELPANKNVKPKNTQDIKEGENIQAVG